MEIVGAASGVAKIALQVVSNHRRPNLEIYQRTINRFPPEVEFRTANDDMSFKSRSQEVAVEFHLVNIGGCRAEDVNLTLRGEFDRKEPLRSLHTLGVFRHLIPSIPPGQTVFLMKLDEFDLYDYVYKDNVGTPNGITSRTLEIEMSYNGPRRGWNKILRCLWAWRSKKQYIEIYHFVPKILAGDLPTAEYA